jgi:chorismate synthase
MAIMGNTFGHLFRITTFGESHGGGVGVVIDGCPPRLEITEEEIQFELDRRRPGQSKITTPRKEADRCEILSGVFAGRTLGTPISILVRNQDQRSQDYDEMATKYRPSHADATYDAKYGIRNYQGGGTVIRPGNHWASGGRGDRQKDPATGGRSRNYCLCQAD